MKKISLICAVALSCIALSGCGIGSHNLHKSVNHSTLIKKGHSKHHKHNKKHSTKSKKSTKQSASNKNSSSSKKNNSSDKNKQQANNKQATQNSNSIPPEYQKNIDKGLEWDGTRRRDSFKSDADFERYNAWHQGYNYDPNTNTYTQMNQQQLNQMRQSMNRDGGQDFK